MASDLATDQPSMDLQEGFAAAGPPSSGSGDMDWELHVRNAAAAERQLHKEAYERLAAAQVTSSKHVERGLHAVAKSTDNMRDEFRYQGRLVIGLVAVCIFALVALAGGQLFGEIGPDGRVKLQAGAAEQAPTPDVKDDTDFEIDPAFEPPLLDSAEAVSGAPDTTSPRR